MGKIALWVIGGFLVIGTVSAAINTAPETDRKPLSEIITPDVAPAAAVIETQPEPTESTSDTPAPTPTSTPTYYINTDGNKIQSPTYYNSAPAGATAQCGDATYSFSQHRSGTCSHHGGVGEWL